MQQEAFKFCRAVKTGRFLEEITFPWKDGPEVINPKHSSRPRIIFGLFIKQKIFDCGIREPVIVPVPSRDGLMDTSDFRSYQMVREALQGDANYPIFPIVRFTESLTPANAGGPRKTSAILPFIKLSSDLPHGNIIIVDDILSSGGSLRAVWRRMTENHAPVSNAIVCGYTVHDASLQSFGNHQLKIDIDEVGENADMLGLHKWQWE